MTSGYVPSDLGKLRRLAVLRELHNLDNEEASDGKLGINIYNFELGKNSIQFNSLKCYQKMST